VDPGGWFRRPAGPENYKRIWISPTWDRSYRDLAYHHEPFNNRQDVETWQQLGFTQHRFTGDMYDMRQPEPDIVAAVRSRLPLKHFCWSFYRMRPGDVLPAHSDTYQAFRRLYDLAPQARIRRYVIFLEDWQSGHYFEIDGVPVTQWVAGDAVLWHDGVVHAAANLGSTHRYTLQITGVIDPDQHPWQLQHFNDSIF
jgi:hypothetical protein